jgi:hypothetical protein
MACDFGALANVDPADPDSGAELMQQCMAVVFDPVLWAWAVGLTVVGGLGGMLIGKYTGAMRRDVILGIALGPFGWIVSGILYVAQPKVAKVPLCPKCGGLVDRGDAHCRHCGADLRP